MSNPPSEPTSTKGAAVEAVGQVSSSAASAAGSVAGAAKDEATGVASSAAGQAKEVAAQAKDQARSVMSSAADSAWNAFQQTTAEARAQADQRTRQAAEVLRGTTDQFQALAEGRTEDAGPIGDYARQVAEQLSQFADRLDEGGVGGLLEDAARFARRRPGLFLVGAAAAGFAVGRFLRNQGGNGSGASQPQAIGGLAPVVERGGSDRDGRSVRPEGVTPMAEAVEKARSGGGAGDPGSGVS